MYISGSEMLKRPNVVVLGTGQVTEQNLDAIVNNLNVQFFCNSFQNNWTDDYYKGISCVDKENICCSHNVIVSMRLENDYLEAKRKLLEKNLLENKYEMMKGKNEYR